MGDKKSKKKNHTSANGHVENINISQNDLQSQENKQSIEKKKEKKREHQEVDESPCKKKKSNKEEENNSLRKKAQKGSPCSTKSKNEMETDEEVELDENMWLPEQTSALLEAIKTQIPVTEVTAQFKQVQSYKVHLHKISWEDVLSAINSKTQGNSKTTKQCQDQFHRVLDKVGTIKSLNQILDEAVRLNPRIFQRKVLNARTRFIKDYMSRRKGDKNCTVKEVKSIWANLPAEEKNKWEEEFQNELQQNRHLYAKSKSMKIEGPENSKFPFELYHKARTAKGEEISSADAKSKYQTLSLKDKIPFIVESLKQQKVYEAEATKYFEENPTKNKTKAHGPTNFEIKSYLESIGMPVAPPIKPIIMYYRKEMQKFIEESKNDSANIENKKNRFKPYQRAKKAFSNLPEEQKDQYKSDCKKAWVEYLSEVEKWKPMIEEKYPEILEQARAVLALVRIPSIVNHSA